MSAGRTWATYIQDALDLIEFANGPVTSVWGARRAAMGHAEPFHMTMLGVGNEQWGPQYLERLAIVYEGDQGEVSGDYAGIGCGAVRRRMIGLRICGRGYGRGFEAGGHGVDVVDQHCYAESAVVFEQFGSV